MADNKSIFVDFDTLECDPKSPLLQTLVFTQKDVFHLTAYWCFSNEIKNDSVTELLIHKTNILFFTTNWKRS